MTSLMSAQSQKMPSRFSADSVRNPACFKSADLYFFPDIEKNESAGNLCVTFHTLTAEMQIDFSV